METSSRERNILILAGLVAVVFVANSVLPAIRGVYLQRQEGIEDVLLNVEREVRLVENSALWQQRREAVESRRADLEAQIFSGDTVPLIEAAIQRELTQYARDADIAISSTRLAERLETGAWLMITQEMQFRTGDAGNTLALLGALESSRPRLFVKDFSLNRTRSQYTGAITVVGFARNQNNDGNSEE